MIDSERGERMNGESAGVTRRREGLGMNKRALAAEAGINRNTLLAVEQGLSFNRTTLTKIERALVRLEQEAGIDTPPRLAPSVEPSDAAPATEIIRVRVGDIEVVVEGPIANRDQLVDDAARLLRIARGEIEPGSLTRTPQGPEGFTYA